MANNPAVFMLLRNIYPCHALNMPVRCGMTVEAYRHLVSDSRKRECKCLLISVRGHIGHATKRPVKFSAAGMVWSGYARYEYNDHSVPILSECTMTTMKAWMGDRLNTPQKARSTLSTFAIAGGAFGFLLVVVAAFIGR
jgi:hypothetical protein